MKPFSAGGLPWILAASLLAALPTQAQTPPDTLEMALPEVEIQAARAGETEASAPFSVTVRRREAAAVALEPGLSLAQTLRSVPGLWLADRGHYALGERVVIRGMGWRAAFGVRGIQALLDGIPLTLPDGQAVLDVVDPAFIRQAEVLRGPASLFWGNGSGGVLFLSTAALADTATARLRLLGGSHGLRQAAAEATLPLGRHRLHAFASRIHRDGHRAHSRGGFTRASLHAGLDLGPASRLRLTAAAAWQDVEAPGGLTAEQVRRDPRQADARFVAARAGKESAQIQAGATLTHQAAPGLLTATVYGLHRRLDNPLTFAYIDLGRAAGGFRLQLQNRTDRLAWGAGFDAGWQRDDRLNLDNDGGQPGQARSLDQQERVRSLAAFGTLTLHLTTDLDVTAGLRLDAVRFALDDRLLDDGNDSGSRDFSALSPAAGLSYRFGQTLVFANMSTAFETPTTTELVNRPDGQTGFNPSVGPQRTLGFEVGVRGGGPRLRFDAAAYRLAIRDRLLPFQNDAGRTFFRNAGENVHQGVELALGWTPQPGADVTLTYTANRFVFEDDPIAQNRIPGVPDHRLAAGLRLARRGLWLQLTAEVVADAFADDANRARNDGYGVFDLNAGHTGLWVGRARLLPFATLSNVFDAAYSGSLVVNAFGGRYFEPSPGRTLQAGLNLVF